MPNLQARNALFSSRLLLSIRLLLPLPFSLCMTLSEPPT